MSPVPDLHETMARHVESGAVPGLVTAVYRRGETRVDALGKKAVGGNDSMPRDAIFRIASMSKPITAAAAMTLVDEGKLRLGDPIERFLPELANRRVLARIDAPLDETVPAKRPITLDDLLTFRMGFGIVWGPPDRTAIQRASEELRLGAFGPPKPQEPPAPEEWMRRFATLPLMYQPGERWAYNTGLEVLSVLLARASGKPLGVLLKERIFEPLGMTDTSFDVPVAKLDRLPPQYWPQDPFADGGSLALSDGVADSQWSRPPAFPSGAGGLVSTADDFLAFAKMMLGRGALGTTRVLSEAAVDAMTTDHLTADQKAISDVLPKGYWKNHGWGLGMATVTGPDEASTSTGRYGWDGGLGTSWYTDPKNDLIGILLTQRAAFPGSTTLYRDFWKAVHGAP
jgi:CubicO group peptidase (beta-lactamase class C family)